MATSVNVNDLRTRVQDIYREVAERPAAGFHFEVGRELALRLGYDRELLERVPASAVDSFAGVGCPFLATEIRPGEEILDLGSGSGMDSCVAALLTGSAGSVIGIDMTEAQLEKARNAARSAGISNVEFRQGFIEALPVPDESVDVVISNGVINLAADKASVFAEITRVLKPGGRMAIADIVSEKQLSENIVCDASLWAACIGGATQQDGYMELIEGSGLDRAEVTENDAYRFLSSSALKASSDYGVKSVTVLAYKPG